jgi:hypothetical protein
MSQLLINEYLKQLDVIQMASGSDRETIVREAFKDLLKNWGKQHGLVFLAEYPLKTATKANITVDARCCTSCLCRAPTTRNRSLNFSAG